MTSIRCTRDGASPVCVVIYKATIKGKEARGAIVFSSHRWSSFVFCCAVDIDDAVDIAVAGLATSSAVFGAVVRAGATHKSSLPRIHHHHQQPEQHSDRRHVDGQTEHRLPILIRIHVTIPLTTVVTSIIRLTLTLP